MSEYRLVMKGVVKTFPGVKALDHAQLELRPGKVMALMGENGAGKSTLMKCMFGIYKMDEGEIEYEGQKVNIPTPLDALNRGIAMVHQELQPIPARTVAENIWLGRYPTKKAGPITIVDHAKMYKDTDELLKKLKLDIKSHAKLGTLSIAQMQMVEIAKAVSANCKVLILDEPTSSLTANEVESLFRIMNELKEQGVALVYISHKMDEIKVIADEVTIMRDGHYIGKWDVANMTKEEIIAKMVGRELSNLYPPLENHPSDEIMMKVEDFTSIHPRSFRHCSFELKKGEILGVAGLVGAQRTELMEGIFGLRAHTAGKVWIKGEEVNIKQPRDAIQKSVALLTEDRRATGILGVLGCPAQGPHHAGQPEDPRSGGYQQGKDGHQGTQSQDPDQEPFRRQPAEGADRPLACQQPRCAHSGRAYPWHRRRCKVRNLLHHRRSGQAGQEHYHDLL